MSLRIVVDMNLSVEWIPLLEQAGWTAVHWSAIGDPRAERDSSPCAACVTGAHGPDSAGCLRQYERELSAGALLVVDAAKSRVRILPL